MSLESEIRKRIVANTKEMLFQGHVPGASPYQQACADPRGIDGKRARGILRNGPNQAGGSPGTVGEPTV